MNKQDLETMLKQTDSTPNRKAKQRAMHAAMQTFRKNKQADRTAKESINSTRPSADQEFFSWLRLRFMNTHHKSNRGRTMKKPLIYGGGLATACLGVVAVSLISLNKESIDDTFIDGPIASLDEEVDLIAKLDANKIKASDQAVVTKHFQPPKKPEIINENIARQEIRENKLSDRTDSFSHQDNINSAGQAKTKPTVSTAAATEAKTTLAQRNRLSTEKRSLSSSAAIASSIASSPVERIVQPGFQQQGRDQFETINTNPIKLVTEEPVSTFSIDVDTASYSFVRRQLNHGVLPQKDAVRIEELINYFDYQYPLPESKKQPFKPTLVVNDSPWQPGNKLVHIGIKGYDIVTEDLPRSNLVFLLDVSGSMNSPDKLPLVKQSMELLLSQLQPEDTIAIAVYAGAAGTVLEPTPVKEKQKILNAMNSLSAGGSTAGAEGIKLAYELAESQFDPNAVNRIILATDGDFNVGITDRDELKGFVERKRDKGIFLSVLGFGQGNYNDHTMQSLAQNGNGIAAYIDTLSEAQKVLVDQATGTLFTIAKDVKIQVEFNPTTVDEYRLLGYETRALNREDFNNDAVDAGDIGAGHSVTAIYEITPKHAKSGLIDESRYQPQLSTSDTVSEYGFLKIRYKLPESNSSELMTTAITSSNTKVKSQLANEIQFSTSVAGFAQLLRGGQYTGNWGYDHALELAQAHKGGDPYGYRTEFVQLIRKAKIADEL